ncbi:MAG: hypothetical protein JRF06_04175 [Deltaproteobacteria bacterium]|nr:hypothetical protein [Deltaproteobacteria bacterium]
MCESTRPRITGISYRAFSIRIACGAVTISGCRHARRRHHPKNLKVSR